MDDTLQDSASDISSVTTKKKQRKSTKVAASISPSPSQKHKKQPICNDVFIDLSSLRIRQFPEEMLDRNFAIRMLYLENNCLTKLPDGVFPRLQKLEWLDVRNNQLTTLPIDIKLHPNLSTILLQGNKFEKLPLELCTLPQLKTLLVAHNPLIAPTSEIIALGCPSILKFLREEWNKLHPEEFVQSPEGEIQTNLSTILCDQTPRKDKTKFKKNFKIFNEYPQPLKRITGRQKRLLYRPSNRCENTGSDIVIDQRRVWISKIKEMFNNQDWMLQKLKDEAARKKWRQDKRSFNISMEKAAIRNEDDIPFAIHVESYDGISKGRRDQLNKKKREKIKFTPPTDIDKKIDELLQSLNKLEVTTEPLTPKSEQKGLRNKIEKILSLQNEIQYIKQCNEIRM